MRPVRIASLISQAKQSPTSIEETASFDMKALKIVGQEPSSCGSDIHYLTDDASYVQSKAFKGRAAVITLGCAKNQVDSEVMLGVLEQSGFEIVSEVERADVAIVNTCGFLQSSIKESVDCILEVAELKKSGQLRKLIVAGCAVERYRETDGADLREALPEVDSFISVNDLMRVGQVASGEAKSLLEGAERPYFLYDERSPRRLGQTHTPSAYVKIAEGCNRPCTFCIIPRLRGPMRSRRIESVVSEVIELGSQGVREINLVAQDLTSFGLDSKEQTSGSLLSNLLKALDQTKAVDWIRLLYAYPIGIDQELLQTIVELPTVCNYLDIPLQHVSESVLKPMKRPLGRFAPRNLVEFMRTTAPEIHLRTTFIVGFPGETDQDVQQLEAFVREGHFSSVGVFTYSQEEGTPAFDLEGQVNEAEKTERRNRIMEAQQESVRSRLEGFVGKSLKVLIEGAHEDTELLITGRSSFQAPEVDGVVLINDSEIEFSRLASGVIIEANITEVAGYDLVGKAQRLI